MSDLRYRPSVTPAVATADDGLKTVQGFREGSISTTTFIQRMVAAGRVFCANAGSATTPITGLTTYAALRPENVLRVPQNIVAIPIEWSCALEVSSGTVLEWSINVAQNDVGNGTSSAATLGPINLRTDTPNTSVCNFRVKYTADMTASTNPIEVFRFGQELATAAGAFAPNPLLWRPEAKPLLVGPASLIIFDEATSAAQQYFSQLTWIETPANWWV